MGKYIISVDQSTQGTKALLFDSGGELILRTDLPHKQLVNDKGWVSHDLNEIYQNVIKTVKMLVERSGISTGQIAAIGLSNQRETTAVWDRETGEPLADAIVWQCGRACDIVEELKNAGYGEQVQKTTGIPLSAYFPAAKMAWLLQKSEQAGALNEKAQKGEICLGTIDSWMIYKLTADHAFKTDYSNASRTQLFNLETLAWDADLCRIFAIPMCCLAQVCDSDAVYGYTDMGGLFEQPVPICGVLGDSHAALFGQGCLEKGMIKATYGTGSSLMMNIGEKAVYSSHGVVTSLAFGRQGQVSYVLEGNLNYTGAVITWLKEDMGMLASSKESEKLALAANPKDRTCLVPAFTGLGAPYWDEKAKAAIIGMSRTTGKAEVVKAALECIAFQIEDLILAMEEDTGMCIEELRVDGGPTGNRYLMQFQSDIAEKKVKVPKAEELSGIGAAYMAGCSVGLYRIGELFKNRKCSVYMPVMDHEERRQKYTCWKKAVGRVLTT